MRYGTFRNEKSSLQLFPGNSEWFFFFQVWCNIFHMYPSTGKHFEAKQNKAYLWRKTLRCNKTSGVEGKGQHIFWFFTDSEQCFKTPKWKLKWSEKAGLGGTHFWSCTNRLYGGSSYNLKILHECFMHYVISYSDDASSLEEQGRPQQSYESQANLQVWCTCLCKDTSHTVFLISTPKGFMHAYILLCLFIATTCFRELGLTVPLHYYKYGS